MKVIADLTIVPIGVGVSLSRYIAECEKILSQSNCKVQLHANGTNLEGEWEDLFGAIKKCHEKLHEMGAPRIFCVIHAGTRNDRDQTMDDKIKSVRSKLG